MGRTRDKHGVQEKQEYSRVTSEVGEKEKGKQVRPNIEYDEQNKGRAKMKDELQQTRKEKQEYKEEARI